MLGDVGSYISIKTYPGDQPRAGTRYGQGYLPTQGWQPAPPGDPFVGPVAPPIPGDCDQDGDVDMTDFNSFADCLTGPEASVDPECECFDLNADGCVALDDFAMFQVSFGS
jgi:hypothetical protein